MCRRSLAAIALLCAACCAAAARVQPAATLKSHPTTPSWPESYSVSYIFSLPFTAKIQPDMISYPVSFHRDAGSADSKSVRVRLDTLNGTNVMIATPEKEYELVPRLDRQVCRIFKNVDEGESVASMTALPDVSGWVFQGGEALLGQAASVWLYERRHEGKVASYRFYIGADGAPLRLHMHGNDIFSGAHFDEWVVDYTSYSPGRPESSVFDKPDCCKGVQPVSARGPSAGAIRLTSVLPAVRYGGDPEYDVFLATHGATRRHASLAEYYRRRAAFARNVATIASHNANANRSFSMAMNHFGDWTREEFIAVMLPRHGKRDAAEAGQGEEEEAAWGKERKRGKHELEYEPLADPSRLPSAVDWRSSGADGLVGVKDQANCGSCWVFGAVGAMEAAWFWATGQRLSLSEQQVMDCSWGFVPDDDSSTSACDGGDAWAGVGHAVDAGGVAASPQYQYLGQADYCTEDSVRSVAKFKGYVRLPRYDDAALMEAVYSRGPVAVSLDASQDSFTFYSSGVYYDTACMWRPSQLDHSMMLVGHGTELAGDYWLVRNSWSDNWGDGGYVKVARDGRGCGASTDAMYAVADPEAAAAAVAADGKAAAMKRAVEQEKGAYASAAR